MLTQQDIAILCRELTLTLIDHAVMPSNKYGFASRVLEHRLKRYLVEQVGAKPVGPREVEFVPETKGNDHEH